MELYVKIGENGQVINDPYFGDNLRDALGIEPSTHPDYRPFKRIAFEETGLKFKLNEKPVCSYRPINGIWSDNWSIEKLQGSELDQRILEIKERIELFKEDNLIFCDNLIASTNDFEVIEKIKKHKEVLENFTVTNLDVYEIDWPKLDY